MRKINSDLIESSEIVSAKRAVYALFFAFGIAYLSLLSRMVKIRELLGDINPSMTGVMLLCVATGSVIAAPIAGALIDRFSVRRFVRIFSICQVTAIMLIGLFATFGNYYAVLICCPFFGLSASTFNVANNMAGVAVERRAGKTLMPRFHAMFCVGAVTASTASTLFANFELPLMLHFSIVALTVASIALINARKIFRTHKVETDSKIENVEEAKTTNRPKPKIDSTLLLIGTIVLASTFCEGSGNDWIALGVSQFGVAENIAITPLWVFLCCQTAMRFFGTRFVDKFGEVFAVRLSFVSAAIGVILFAFSPTFPLIYFATALWGFGVALGYPLGISAAAKNPENSAFRASVVASIGTAMNIAGPPMIGFLADISGIRHALLLTTIPLMIALFTCRVLRVSK